MSSSCVDLSHVGFSYGGPNVLDDVSVSVLEGEFFGVVGPNGGGKSTLLKLVLGLLSPSRGEVRVFGKSPLKARNEIGYVAQFMTFNRSFPISVLDTVLMGRLGPGTIGRVPSADRIIAEEVLGEVGISHLADVSLDALSGGQLQRVLLARALAGRPRMLVLDEPTASVDARGEEHLFDLLKTLNSKVTVIVVSHDIGFISRYVTRVACVNRSLVCHHTHELTGEVIERLYGGPLSRICHHSHEPEVPR